MKQANARLGAWARLCVSLTRSARKCVSSAGRCVSSARMCVSLGATAALFTAVVSLPARGMSQLPQFDDLDLSPDGSHLLMIRASGEVYDVVVRNLATDEDLTLYAGDPDTGLVNWCRWGNLTRVVCSVRTYAPAPRIGQVTHTRLFAVDRDGKHLLPLVPKAKNRERWPQVWNAQVQDRVLSWLVEDDEHILIQLNRDHANRPSVYRLNIYDNNLIREYRPRTKVRRWYSTFDGKVRLAIGYENESTPVVYRVKGREMKRYTGPAYQSDIPPQPVGFSDDGKFVYMSMTNGQDRHALYKVEVETGAVVEEIFRDPDFDVFGGVIMHPESGEPVGVSYLAHHPRLVWFEPKLKALFTKIREQLPGAEMRLVSTDTGYDRFIVHSYGDIAPRYYLYDRPSGKLTLIGRDFLDLADEDVVDLVPVKYRTRDALDIPAYLATPKTAGPHPTILLPHGGPYSRDSAEFDGWTQYFINQGFAVLKPNYRGSVGYGESYMQAGYKQWGLKMQEDLMDGLQWLVDQGIADADRVCVVGASYGGYTALVSAYKYADRIACAVSLAGISDLEDMVIRMYNFDLAQRNRERIQDSKDLAANSPIRQVQSISVPVLLLHGKRDTVVRVKQSRRFAQALTKHGKPHRYVEQEQGDHFLSMASQREEFFEEVSAFLDEHISPGE